MALGCGDDSSETGGSTTTATGGTGGSAGAGGVAGSGGTGGAGGTAQTGTVAGTLTLDGSVTCGTEPGNDCQGLLVGIALECGEPECAMPPWLGQFENTEADLSGGTASYEFLDLPAGQDVYIVIALLETATSSAPAQPGDLASPIPPTGVTVQAGSTVTWDLAMTRIE
ncbi:MAG: hypothetical protein DRI90_13830 [Deltaproteobacteria bacterium]|nr:MAG: hypothetical protein DRI90_13830 [Deltaproteobacteria bacterium]